MKTIADRLKQLRGQRGYSQKYIENVTDINDSTLSRLETEKSKPLNEHLLKLADLYGVSMDWLYGRTDDPTFPPVVRYETQQSSNFPVPIDLNRLKEHLISHQVHANGKSISQKQKNLLITTIDSFLEP
ncbi:MAG TPA: helix-turn-helix transcriptional regulator [Bacilli bacterium]|nr:helix-turn-helix transcriptional regulator [Bacilli bacterium]